MWIVKCGKLVFPNKIELSYIRKDQLISLNTQGICQSIEIFCPHTVQISKLPWKKIATINTQDWVLSIIKLNGVAKTLDKPIVFAKLNTVEELYHHIIKSDRKIANGSTIDSINQVDNNNSFSTLDSDYPAQYT